MVKSTDAWTGAVLAMLLAYLAVLTTALFHQDGHNQRFRERLRALEAVTHDHRAQDDAPRYPPHWRPR